MHARLTAVLVATLTLCGCSNAAPSGQTGTALASAGGTYASTHVIPQPTASAAPQRNGRPDFVVSGAWQGMEPGYSKPFELAGVTTEISWSCPAQQTQAFGAVVVPATADGNPPTIEEPAEIAIDGKKDGGTGKALFRPKIPGGYQILVSEVLAVQPCTVTVSQPH